MKSPRAFLIETGILLALIFPQFSFGAVYPWGYGILAAIFFSLLLIKPEAVLSLFSLPRFIKICLFLVLGWLLVQTFFFSLQTQTSRYQMMIWTAWAVAFCVTQQIRREAIIRLLYAVILIGGLVSAYGLYQVYSGSEMVLWQKKQAHTGFVTGAYFNRNHYAGLMEMVLGVHLGCLIRALHKMQIKTVLFLAVLLIPSFGGFVHSGSRAGFICFAAALFLMAFVLVPRAKNKILFIFLLTGIGAGLGLAWGWGTFTSRFQEALQGDLLTIEGRLPAWFNMVPFLQDFAWKGVGLGNFQWGFPMYQSSALAYGWNHAHQDYLELAIEMGVPAFFLWVTGFFVLAFRSLFNTGQKDFSTFALIWGCLAGWMSLCFHAMTDFNFAIPGNSLMFILLLGFARRLLDFERQELLRHDEH